MALLALWLVTILCCNKYIIADHFAVFNITGYVLDGAGEGINGVEVLFEDTGLDHWVGGRGNPRHVAWSDEKGMVLVELEYAWGLLLRGKSQDDSVARTFRLIFVKNGSVLKELDFNLSDLERRQNTYYVTFEARLLR